MGRSTLYRGLTLIVPDAYSSLDVSRLLTPTAGGVGIVAIYGEADGGAPGVHIFPGGASPAVVQAELKSGPLANAARLALRSGTDPGIQAGASLVLAFKTNPSTQSTAAVGGTGPAVAEQLELTAVADVAGSLDLAYFVLPVDDTDTVGFYIDLDNAGQPAPAGLTALTPTTTVAITAINTGDIVTAVRTALINAINATGFFATSFVGNVITVILNYAGVAAAENDGSGEFGVTVTVPGEDADTDAQATFTTKQYGAFTTQYTLDIVTSLGAKFITVRDENGIPETSPGLGVTTYATLEYTGDATTATMTLQFVANALRLQTTLSGQTDGSVSLNIDVTNLTLQQLKSLIDTYTGYTLSVPQVYLQFACIDLDYLLTPVNIQTGPHEFKASMYEAVVWGRDNSALVTVARGIQNQGDTLPGTVGTTFFTGGVRGSTTNTLTQNALNELLEYRLNILVPLFSSTNQDGSTVDIDACNAQAKDHLISRSSILGRSEAQGYVSISGNKDAFLEMCSTMNSRWVSVVGQSITDLDIAGNVITYPPYGLAVVAAQSQAGSPIGTDLTNKALPILGFSQDVSWNPTRNANELILGGAWIINRDENNVIRVVANYSSWLGDDNNANIYNETVESLAIFAYNHRKYMKQVFLGRSSFSTQDVLTAIETSLIEERDNAKTIKGFDLTLIKIISASAGRLEYEVAVVPFEGIKFVLPTVVAIRDSIAA